MKPREWKWNDVARRLKNVGVDRKAEKCGKKWDNLMQQFKKVHRFQQSSGGVDFFLLSSKERASNDFNFNMDRAVYDEIKGSTGFNETINPKNVADTGARGRVRLPSPSNGDPEAVAGDDEGAGGKEEEEGSTRDSSQMSPSPGGFGKRKSVRQQTFEAMTDCLDKHGALMAATMESASKRQCSIQLRQCEALEAEVQVQKEHYAASDEVSKLMCHALMEIAKAIRERVARGRAAGKQVARAELAPKKGRHDPLKRRRTVQGGKAALRREVESAWVDAEETQVEDDDFEEEGEQILERRVKQRMTGAARMEAGGGVAAEAGHDQQRTPSIGRTEQPVGVASSSQAVIDSSTKRSPAPQARGEATKVALSMAEAMKAGDGGTVGEDDEALVNRLRGQRAEAKAMEVAARLWTDDIRFWNQTWGHEIIQIIHEALVYLVDVATGVQPSPIRRSINLLHSSIPVKKIEDGSELTAAKERALKVETIAKRAIQGWIFKSESSDKGYHLVYQYASSHAATNIARAMCAAEDWRSLVSSMVFRTTLELGMKLLLWFVGAKVEDRHQDDECEAYQEAIAQRLVRDFSNVVEAAQAMDSGRVSHKRLKSLAEAMRYLLAAAAWIMRMAGDDARSHFDAWVFVQLTAKTTLLASMDRHFDSRRHVLLAATVMTEKLGRPPPTFAPPPLYIPDWASKCGITFNHDATLSSPMEATETDWIATGPMRGKSQTTTMFMALRVGDNGSPSRWTAGEGG
ncbi:hypothetical protein CBR_g50082 [Chara braunii]|uniref:Myb/SANT-like DNA-binding domain-containing protein n=1 Tax=Chara braunii TaxID=69332 RepID=A0A388M610_CHABU|nr:hypothetical protein CBR_g50082 [Chara braunii]|eukprot:GBG89991.1 hypothetical protein CBR_g50082 [Chara braunii]